MHWLVVRWTSLRPSRFHLWVPALILAASSLLAAENTAAQSSRLHFENARIEAIDSTAANFSINDCIQQSPGIPAVCRGPAITVKVDNPSLRAELKTFHVGDHIRLDITNVNGANQLQDVQGLWSVSVGLLRRTLALAISALLVLGLATAVTRGAPLKFIVGMDNRYSNSKFQVAAWFWLLISTYLATVALRVTCAGWEFLGAVDIPQNLLMLSGLSALTYGGAKAITTAKVNAALNPILTNAGAATPAPNPDPKNSLQPGQEKLLRDLVQNDLGAFDFGDFQMLVVTLLAISIYLVLIFHFLGTIAFTRSLTLPDVDTTILATFGLGQGAYLTKKAAGNVGSS